MSRLTPESEAVFSEALPADPLRAPDIYSLSGISVDNPANYRADTKSSDESEPFSTAGPHETGGYSFEWRQLVFGGFLFTSLRHLGGSGF
jgi:hypothetical protein